MQKFNTSQFDNIWNIQNWYYDYYNELCFGIVYSVGKNTFL